MKMNLLRFVGAQTVDLPLMGADPSGPFVLKSVEGLGPPEVNVRMAQTVLEGGLYQGKRPALRQIIALIGLQPNWDVGQTPEELRTQLYSLLTPKYGKMVQAQIMYNGVVQGFAQGQVSKIEAALFSKDPAVQITLECDYPYFLAPTTVTQSPVQRTVSGIRAFDIENDGTAPSGFIMGLILRAPVTDSNGALIVSDIDPAGQKIQVDGITWAPGDKLKIDTRAGSRGVWRGPAGGSYQSILNNMNGGVSEWLQLYGGDNTLTINTTAFDWDPNVKFAHQPAFWGV